MDYKDYNQRDYFFQMQQMRQMQIPFPPMYPYPDLYMNEIETDRDLQYLQQMYPLDAKRMQKRIEEECDKLEYEGSMMYDEYPDRVSMLLICDRIADAIAKEEAESQALQEAEQMDTEAGADEDINAMQMLRPAYSGADRSPYDPDRRRDRPPYDSDRRPDRPPYGSGHGPGRPPQGRPPLDPGRRNLLEVLLYNEMYRRRSKNRRTRRFW